MKLYILRPVDPDGGPWDQWYDRCFCMVVRAGDEFNARRIASQNAGAEYLSYRKELNPWLDPSLVCCDELTAEGDEELIIRDVANA